MAKQKIKLEVANISILKNLDEYSNKLNFKRKKFKTFKVGDIVNLINKDRTSNEGKSSSHLFVRKGKIIFANSNNIIIQDLEKSYKKFTVDINSYLINDIIINIQNIKEEKDEQV
jgi:hypothetical protein